jgi:signal transduction histidine kinase
LAGQLEHPSGGPAIATTTQPPLDWRDWVPETVGGVLVLILGITEALTRNFLTDETRLQLVWISVFTALAVSLSRHLPSAALGLVWLVCGYQLIGSIQIMLVQITMAVVAFGAARWGRTLTVVASGLSIPIAGILVTAFASYDLFAAVVNQAQYQRLYDAVRATGTTWQFAAAAVGTMLLAAPWLAGLTMRFSTRAAESRISQLAAQADAARANVESEQAHEIARLREEQARLARDVHDVVGHSLAVILAQAEAAQYLPDDPAQLKGTMATIATSARGSLQDVRQVLSATQAPAAPRDGDLDSLIDGVRNSGHDLDSSEVGARQPLPPELEVVAYRVLQEMLTNALKYGRRDQAVRVERHWPDSHGPDGRLADSGDLRIEVRNMIGSPDDTGAIPSGSGQGLTGMRRRLEAVGGRLDVRQRDEATGVSFTCTAWIPVRPR